MRRALGWIVLAGVWLHQLAIAWLAPLSGDDWLARADGPSWPTTGALYHALIVDVRLVHLALTPILIASLPLALATLARGRRVRPGEPDDALLLLLIASLLWLAVPRFGLTCAMRAAAAIQLVPVVLAAWYAIAFRAAVRGGARGWQLALLALGGVIVGDATRPIAGAAIVLCAAFARRAPARGAAIAGLAGLGVGAAIALPPDLGASLARFAERGLPADLHDLAASLRVSAWMAAPVIAIWIAHLTWLRATARAGRPLDQADVTRILRAGLFALVPSLIALVTTDLRVWHLVTPGAAAVIALALALAHLAHGRRGRIAIVVGAIAVQAWAIGGSIGALVPAHRDFEARIAALHAAAPGTIATVPPYTRPRPGPWAPGDDFRGSGLRDRIATELFGLRGITIAPVFDGVEPVPPLALAHAVDGGDAGMPGFYSADLETARAQFADAIARLRPRAARLIAVGLTVPGRTDPVVAAWADADGARWWRAHPDGVDRRGYLRLTPPPVAVQSMWSFDLGRDEIDRLARADDGRYLLEPGRRRTAGIVACTIDRCALAAVVSLY